MQKIVVWWALGIMLAYAAAASVVINQVLYNPAGTESGGEAVEIYSNETIPIDISGWKLATEASMNDAVIPPGTFICPGCRYIIADDGWNESKDNSTWANADHTEPISLYNTDSGVALMDKNSIIMDAVGWGDANSIKAGFYEGNPSPLAEEGKALLRTADTNDNSKDFIPAYPDFRSSLSNTYTEDAEIRFEIKNITAEESNARIKITPNFIDFKEITAGKEYLAEIEIENTGDAVVDIAVRCSGFTSNKDSIESSAMEYAFGSDYKPMPSSAIAEDMNLNPGDKTTLKIKLIAPKSSLSGEYAGKISITAVKS